MMMSSRTVTPDDKKSSTWPCVSGAVVMVTRAPASHPGAQGVCLPGAGGPGRTHPLQAASH